MARRLVVAMTAAAWALAAAVTARADESEVFLPNPVLESGSRWAFDGFSILPPPGEGWFSLLKTRERAVFVHGVESSDEGAFAIVLTLKLDAAPASREAFLAALRARRATQTDRSRIESVRHEEALEEDASEWCTRYRIEGSEVTPWYASARATTLVGRACRHPHRPDAVVDLAFAVRGSSGGTDAARPDAREAFLRGLRLAAPGSDAAPGSLEQALAAAERGDAAVAVRLAAMYESGRGVARDSAAAENWYRVAAEAGEVDALYNLGVLYERGAGRPRDPAEALRWFRRAADQRDAQAQLNVGLMYYKGDGVERDRRLARSWLGLAAGNGSERAAALLEQLQFSE